MEREFDQKIITAISKAASQADCYGIIPKSERSTLTDLLSASGKYSEFDEKLHTVGDTGARFTFDDLVKRLATRSISVGAETALSELNAYIEAEELRLVRLLLLHNTHIEEDFTFSNGVRLLRVESLPASRLRDLLYRRQFDRFIGGHANAVLAIDFVHKKRVHTDDDKPEWSILEEQTKQTKILDDTRLILSLARSFDHGIPVVAATTLIPDNLEFLDSDGSYNPYPDPHIAFGPSIIPFEADIADRMLTSFNAMDDATKDRLRIALKRLNDTKIDPEWSNKSINLRICLENIFLNPDEGSQIRRRIQERMPTMTDFSKTRSGKVYGMLSTAVHTGNTQHHPEFDEQTVAKEVQKVLRKILEDGGYPVWPTSKRQGLMWCQTVANIF